MKNRIDKTFQSLKRNKKKAFIAFITAGDPSLSLTEQLVIGFENTGVDIVELGVPFSDPLADGPTIQASSERAVSKGINLDKIFRTVQKIRKRSQIPIALMTYYNPVYHYGIKKFIKKSKISGVDGIIVPDLPPEEGFALIQEAKAENITTIFFLSPTTTTARLKHIVRVSSGFIYFVSLTGVTGARARLPNDLIKKLRFAKKYTQKPICVGFGISTAAQIKSVARVSDGVIVGSAIIKEIEKHKGKKNLIKNVLRYVDKLSKGLSK